MSPRGNSQNRNIQLEPTSVCANPGPVAMLNACLRLLVLLPLVCCVPSSSRPPSRICRRCCDFQDSPAPSAQYQTPEVRTVINMTILKGSQSRPCSLLFQTIYAEMQVLAWLSNSFAALVCLGSVNQIRKIRSKPVVNNKSAHSHLEHLRLIWKLCWPREQRGPDDVSSPSPASAPLTSEQAESAPTHLKCTTSPTEEAVFNFCQAETVDVHTHSLRLLAI